MSYTGSLSYFDRVSAIGDRMLRVIGGAPATTDTDQYLELVEQIYKALADIHDNLIDVTIEVDQAKTIGEVSDVLERIQQLGIKDTLKAQNMCNELGRMGYQMRGLPSEQLNLNDQEKADWDELSHQLERREGGTAMLYDDKLRELYELGKSKLGLKSLQAKVAEISDLLVVQKAQFERLAKRAKLMRNKRP